RNRVGVPSQSIVSLPESVSSLSFGNELRLRDPVRNLVTGGDAAVDYAEHASAVGDRATYEQTIDEARRGPSQATAMCRPIVIVPRSRPSGVGRTSSASGTWWSTRRTAMRPCSRRARSAWMYDKRAPLCRRDLLPAAAVVHSKPTSFGEHAGGT